MLTNLPYDATERLIAAFVEDQASPKLQQIPARTKNIRPAFRVVVRTRAKLARHGVCPVQILRGIEIIQLGLGKEPSDPVIVGRFGLQLREGANSGHVEVWRQLHILWRCGVGIVGPLNLRYAEAATVTVRRRLKITAQPEADLISSGVAHDRTNSWGLDFHVSLVRSEVQRFLRFLIASVIRALVLPGSRLSQPNHSRDESAAHVPSRRGVLYILIKPVNALGEDVQKRLTPRVSVRFEWQRLVTD